MTCKKSNVSSKLNEVLILQPPKFNYTKVCSGQEESCGISMAKYKIVSRI